MTSSKRSSREGVIGSGAIATSGVGRLVLGHHRAEVFEAAAHQAGDGFLGATQLLGGCGHLNTHQMDKKDRVALVFRERIHGRGNPEEELPAFGFAVW